MDLDRPTSAPLWWAITQKITLFENPEPFNPLPSFFSILTYIKRSETPTLAMDLTKIPISFIGNTIRTPKPRSCDKEHLRTVHLDPPQQQRDIQTHS